jgi:hypothetical protein
MKAKLTRVEKAGVGLLISAVIVAALGTVAIYSLGHGAEQSPSPSVSAMAVLPSPSATPSDEPTATPHRTPYPGGPELVPVRANETAGTASLSVEGTDATITDHVQFPIVCAWTSPHSVRPAFLQRVRVLGENLELYWSMGLDAEGQLRAMAQVSHGLLTPTADFNDQAATDLFLGPFNDASYVVTRAAGSVTGSIEGRASLFGDFWSVGDATAQVSLAWDCGAAPAGVTGTARPDPTGAAYESAWDRNEVPAEASSGGATITVDDICPGDTADAAGGRMSSGCSYSDFDFVPRPSSKVLVVAAGSTIEISAGGRWIPWPAGMSIRPAPPSPEGTEVWVAPILADGSRLVFPAPASGSYYVTMGLVMVDDLGWTQGGSCVFGIRVEG